MELTVDKIAMFRDNYNPKNTNLDLNIDWSVEFTHTNQSVIKYDIILRSEEYLNLSLKVGGLIKLEYLEKFVQEEYSQIVFNHACGILMNMISLTRQSNYELLNEDIDSTVNLSATF
ncbi:pilus assembly protein [Methanobrevibacter sp.]|uniref:pilus assembly protein n=1 Tax=Methanobrevibacter sp. TaxID=66852 RepID=UPI0025FFE284|nr:pilus assembly protein [Methanobrevibacter sp.]MBQ2831789.1 pilus assembly protein [Methanobrevibacter sp.]